MCAHLQEVLARLRRVAHVEPAKPHRVSALAQRRSERCTHSIVKLPMLVSTVSVGASIFAEADGAHSAKKESARE